MRKNSALDKRFAAKNVRTNLISNATYIFDIFIKDTFKSFYGYIYKTSTTTRENIAFGVHSVK